MILRIFILIFQVFNFSFMPLTHVNNSHSYAIVSSIKSEENIFARVMFEHSYLFKNPSDNIEYSNLFFELPKSYFVELTDAVGEFYKARYLSFEGYVKKDCVQAVKHVPNNPFLTNISFRVYADLSRQLRSSPTAYSESNLITTIPHLTRNITYISRLKGDCLIEGRTDVWYYCKFHSDKDYYGYVYSDFCDEFTPILDNLEEVEYVSNPTFEPITPPAKTMSMSDNSIGIIIAIISVPAIIFAFLILKGSKIGSQNKSKSREIIEYGD